MTELTLVVKMMEGIGKGGVNMSKLTKSELLDLLAWTAVQLLSDTVQRWPQYYLSSVRELVAKRALLQEAVKNRLLDFPSGNWAVLYYTGPNQFEVEIWGIEQPSDIELAELASTRADGRSVWPIFKA